MPLPSFRTNGRHSLGCAVPHHNTHRAGHCPLAVPYSKPHNFLSTPPIEVFLGILESRCYEPSNALGLILVTSVSMGGRCSQRPGALTHTRISSALSPMVPQVLGVNLGSLLCLWCCGHSLRRGARQCIKV